MGIGGANAAGASSPQMTFFVAGEASSVISPSRLPRYVATPLATKGRLILCTVLGSTPNCLAITRTPGRPGWLRAARMATSFSSEMVGRPKRFPSLLALAKPARTRSWIIDRSNSADTPIIWNSALPAGVVVSMPCWCRCRSTWRAWSSPRNVTSSCRLRPRRSTDQAMTTSNWRRKASRSIALYAGRLSRPLAPLMPWSLRPAAPAWFHGAGQSLRLPRFAEEGRRAWQGLWLQRRQHRRCRLAAQAEEIEREKRARGALQSICRGCWTTG